VRRLARQLSIVIVVFISELLRPLVERMREALG